VEAQAGLGGALARLGRLGEARALFEKALRIAPRNVDALIGLGQIAGSEGKFAEAEELFKRALQVDPKIPAAWAGLVSLRKMSPADSAWLKGAEETAASPLPPVHETSIHYAIGKYYDDTGDYTRAFKSYRRANELQKLIAEPYNGESHTRFVDDLIRIYTREALAPPYTGASDSAVPVLVVGMARSGTTLVEQIIASHPACKSAGEIDFWNGALRKHANAVRTEPLGEPLKRKLAAAYLRVLEERAGEAPRIVDKTPQNSDFLGLIHTIFPKARMIYLQRDPIDTCLSCYFQQFSAVLNYTMDLSDLAHYYREHARLVKYWRSVLPPETLLFVPYAELIADQEKWTRIIIDFLGLEWDPRCLQFHETGRAILTASFWQARQKIYSHSVGRWRKYEKFIGPLLGLRELAP
jgi:tetratricopeptide (TPR) repeat protein